MDLKNNQITVKELLKKPGAKEIVLRFFPQTESVLKNPIMLKMAGGMTLEKVLDQFGGTVSKENIAGALKELQLL